MNANVTFRHMDSSTALREYAVGKLEHVVDKYVNGRVSASAVMSVEKFRHIATFTVQIKNLTVKGTSESEDMYSSIDLALDKIERQLRRHKDRLRDYKPGNADKGQPFRMSVILPPEGVDATDEHDEFAQDYDAAELPAEQEAAPAAAEAPTPPKAQQEEALPASQNSVAESLGQFRTATGESVEVIRPRHYETLAMSTREAVIQLDLMEDREFLRLYQRRGLPHQHHLPQERWLLRPDRDLIPPAPLDAPKPTEKPSPHAMAFLFSPHSPHQVAPMTPQKTARPFGLWPSPLASSAMAQQLKLQDVQFAPGGDQVVWCESRGGGGVLVRWRQDGGDV